METILPIFEDIQNSKRSHKSHGKKINTIITASTSTQQRQKNVNILLNGILDQALLHPKTNANIHRIVDFFSYMAAIADESWKPLIFQHLFARISSVNKAVRQRVSQIIVGFIRVVSQEQMEVEEDLLKQCVDYLLIRLRDKSPPVRTTAIEGLKYFQAPEDEQDPIILQFIELLECDAIASVRNCVAKHISLNEVTKPVLVKRIKDIKPEIRITTLNRLTEETDIRQFSKEMRAEIMQAALNDRDKDVRSAAEKLLLRWLSLLNGDINKLFTYFGPVDNEDIVLLVAATLAESVYNGTCENHEHLKNLSPRWTASLGNIPSSEILWVYVKCSYVNQFKSKFDLSKVCEKLLPDPADYCTLLSTPYDTKHHLNFKLLLQLAGFTAGITDVVGADQIVKKCSDMILDININIDLLDHLLDAYWQMSEASKSGRKPIYLMMELIERLNEPMAPVNEENDEEDGDQLDIATSKNYRAIHIVQWLLEHNRYQAKEMKAGVDLVLQCLQRPSVEMRSVALSCLGMLSVLDQDIRTQYLRIIKHVALGDFEHVSVRAQALGGLLDLCAVANSSFLPEEKTEIDSTLAKLMNSEEVELRNIAIEGSVKLIFGGFSRDPQLVSMLLQYFFIGDGLYQQDQEVPSSGSHRMHQILSVFLQTFLANEESCLEVVRLSISLFISEYTTKIRDGEVEPNDLAKVLQNLFGICNRVLITAEDCANKSNNEEDNNMYLKMVSSYNYLKETAFACICRELLKLGSDKVDKSICKEFMKVLGSLSVVSWIRTNEIASVGKVLSTIKETAGLDKGALKIMNQLLAEVTIASNDDTYERASFFDCAPGLKDLVQISASNWDEPSQIVEPSRRARSTRATRKIVDSDDEESLDEEDDEEEEDETEFDENEE